MALPRIATRAEWLAERRALLAEEKVLTRRRDELSTKRRNLPMVPVDEGYRFSIPDGSVSLLDLFDGCPQLAVRARRRVDRWLVLLPRPDGAGPAGGVGGARGPSGVRPVGQARPRVLTARSRLAVAVSRWGR
jgi:hypothetical protein